MQKVDRFLTQVCYDNTITITPTPFGATPVTYILFGTAALTDPLATISASGPLVFEVCSKTPHATYYIVAVDALGNLSAPLAVSI